MLARDRRRQGLRDRRAVTFGAESLPARPAERRRPGWLPAGPCGLRGGWPGGCGTAAADTGGAPGGRRALRDWPERSSWCRTVVTVVLDTRTIRPSRASERQGLSFRTLSARARARRGVLADQGMTMTYQAVICHGHLRGPLNGPISAGCVIAGQPGLLSPLATPGGPTTAGRLSGYICRIRQHSADVPRRHASTAGAPSRSHRRPRQPGARPRVGARLVQPAGHQGQPAAGGAERRGHQRAVFGGQLAIAVQHRVEQAEQFGVGAPLGSDYGHQAPDDRPLPRTWLRIVMTSLTTPMSWSADGSSCAAITCPAWPAAGSAAGRCPRRTRTCRPRRSSGGAPRAPR